MRQDVSHQFGLLVYSEDTHRIGPVSLDRAAAETQPQADFFARFALGDQLHDLSLTGCQRPLLFQLVALTLVSSIRIWARALLK